MIKIQNVENIDRFFEVVNKCNGKVELVTDNGDKLNLKSKLSQYVALAKAFSGGIIPEMKIEVSDKSDVSRLFHYMYNCAV